MLMFLFRCLWPLGSMTCPTQSCWTSSRSLRGWAKSITSTQSSSNKGPQANFVRLFHLSSEQTGVQKSKKKNLNSPRNAAPARLQLSLPTRTQTASQPPEPSKQPSHTPNQDHHGRAFGDILTASTLPPPGQTANCLQVAFQEPADVSEWTRGWMNV